MRPLKYNFIPEHQLNNFDDSASGIEVTITKQACIYFSTFVIGLYEMKGKYVRIFADIPNKSISWREVKGGNLDSIKNIRKITVNTQGTAVLSVKKILEKMELNLKDLPFKRVPVTKYQGALDEEPYYVIDLRNYGK